MHGWRPTWRARAGLGATTDAAKHRSRVALVRAVHLVGVAGRLSYRRTAALGRDIVGRVSSVDHLPCLAVLMAMTFVRFEAIGSDAAARCSGTLARARLVTLLITGFSR
jgi:hypothetical protein